MTLKVVDQSGPMTIARGLKIYDMEHNGYVVATIEYADIAGEYLCNGLKASDLAQALNLVNELNVNHKPKVSQ